MSNILIWYAERDSDSVVKISNAINSLGLTTTKRPIRNNRTDRLSSDEKKEIVTAHCVMVCFGSSSQFSKILNAVSDIAQDDGSLVPCFVGEFSPKFPLSGRNLMGWDGDVRDPNWAAAVWSLAKILQKEDLFEKLNKQSISVDESVQELSPEILVLRNADLVRRNKELEIRLKDSGNLDDFNAKKTRKLVFKIRSLFAPVLICCLFSALTGMAVVKFSTGKPKEASKLASNIGSASSNQSKSDDFGILFSYLLDQSSESIKRVAWPTNSIEDNNYFNEKVDWKISPQTTMKNNVHGQTPLSIPGATTVTTADLIELGRKAVLVDVWDSKEAETIPGAYEINGAGSPGTFDDNIQKGFANILSLITNNNRSAKIVIFCLDSECWESYNAVLRAEHAGFTNTYWYRGGRESWEAAKLHTAAPALHFSFFN